MNREQSLRRPLYKAFTYNEYIFAWSFKFANGCLLVGATGSAIVLMLTIEPVPSTRLFLLSLLFGVLFFGVGFAWALWERANQFDEMFLESLEPMPETAVEPLPEKPKRDCTVLLDLKNGLSPVTIWQPRPAAFVSWARNVLSNSNKVQFSENQAKMRQWPLDRYHVMIAQLKQIGLLHSHDVHNNAPVMTDEGKVKLKEWLNNHV
jgi:hypothetical protein